MKITIEIDCTPEEGRAFCGLPNVKPMQEAVLAKVEQQMLDAVAAMSPEAILRTWMPFVPQNQEQLREIFGRFFTPPFGGSPGSKS